MIKKVLLIIFLALTFSKSQAWEYECSRTNYIIPETFIELTGGDYLILYHHVPTYFMDSTASCELIRVSTDGHFMDSVSLTNVLPGYHLHGKGMTLINNRIVISGSAFDSIGDPHPFMLELNQNLEVIYQKIHSFRGSFFNTWPLSPSRYLIYGVKGEYNKDEVITLFLTDDQYNIQLQNVDSTGSPRNLGTALVDQTGQYLYQLSIKGLRLTKWSTSTLTMIKEQFTSRCDFTCTPFLNPDHPEFLLAGYSPSTSPSIVQIELHSVDSNLIHTDSSTYHDNFKIRLSYPGTIAYLNGKFYIGAVENLDKGDVLIYSKVNAPFKLLKFSQNLDLEWMNTYHGDCAYEMYGISATTDEKILMMGVKYNWPENADAKTSLYLLKVDTNGYSTGIESIPSFFGVLKLFPNPSSDQIQVVVNSKPPSNEYFITVLSVSGEEMFSSFFMNKMTIALNNWPSGIYFAKVSDTSGHSEFRKFIVQ